RRQRPGLVPGGGAITPRGRPRAAGRRQEGELTVRILHLTTFLQGGAGLAITSLAASQACDGHDVTVVTSRTEVPGYGNYPAYLETLIDSRVRVRQVDSLFDRRPEAHAPVERCIDELGGAGAF